jgi:GntR family transcriptional regulator
MCHIDYVTLFNFTLQRGTPIVEQVVFASIRSILRSEYRPGDTFPSVRAIASNLKIHPNTAHKAVQRLIEDGWLKVHAGIGTVVGTPPKARSGDGLRLVHGDLDHLIVTARSNQVSLGEVIDELRDRWTQLGGVRED